MNLKKIENTDNQEKLMKWAMKSKYDTDIRMAAVRKITDQNMLHTIIRDADRGSVAIVAAKKLDNQTLAQKTYVQMAKNGYAEAVDMIKSHDDLAHVALRCGNSIIAVLAMNRITDKKRVQQICFQIVTDTKNSLGMRKGVFNTLEKGDQEKFDFRTRHGDNSSCYPHIDYEWNEYKLKPGALPPYPEKK